MPPSLSALIIVKDEERDLPGCLESVKGLATEVVVLVDDAATDRTEEIARASGAKVARRSFDDYARQRQAALELCTKDWVLWIDADERVDPTLCAGILHAPLLSSNPTAAYELRFSVRFLGRELRFGGLGVERHVRLFKRVKGRFMGGALHESLQIDGPIGALPGRMIHESYRDLGDYLSKLDRYTTLAARKKWEAGGRFHWWHHCLLPAELFRRLVLRLGFLDGFPGVMWAGLAAFHHWLKYAKLKEMERSE